MKAVLTVLIFLMPFLINAQESNNYKKDANNSLANKPSCVVKGKIADSKSGIPIEFASAVLYKDTDSSLVAGVVSDEKGGFLIENLPYGKYFLKLNFIGYKSLKIKDIKVSPKLPVFNMGVIKFNAEATTLDEVNVTTEKPMVEYSLDKKVVNVEQNITTSGGTAVDVLQQIPSVTIDFDGNVSLRGNSNVTVLIDGRQSSMTAARLQQMPASEIEAIELITNPSAKYNPDGMAGIINLKLKTPKEKGFNGMLMLNAGTGDKYNGSVNLNQKYKKFNLFGSYDGRINRMEGYGDMSRYTDIHDTLSQLTAHDEFIRKRNSSNIKLGADYSINSKNTITFTGLYNISSGNDIHTSLNKETDLKENKLTKYTSDETSNETGNSADFTLNYKRKYDKKDKLLTADAMFSIDKDNDEENTLRQYYNSSGASESNKNVNMKNNTNGSNNSTTVQLNYVNPLGEHSKFETGFQSIIKSTNDDYTFSTYDTLSNEFKNNPQIDNNFKYDQQIHSAYGIYSGEYKKFTFQAGVRVEEALTKGTLLTPTDTTFTYNYFNIYPSAFLTRKIDATQSIQLTYSRRVNRPNMHQLNPFRDISNPAFIHYGNPALKPEYINSFELGYLKYLGSSTLNGSLFYRQINNVIKNLITVDNSTTTEMTFKNLSTGTSYGIELIGDIQIMKGWRASLNYSYFRTEIKGDNLSTSLTNANYSWTSKFNTMITLPYKIGLQLSGNYRGAQVTPQGEMKPMYSADLAIKKDFLKDMATISFRISDLFNTQKFSNFTSGTGFTSEFSRKRDSRVAYISFTYRLNYDPKAKIQKKEQNGNGNGNEDMEGF